MRLDREREARPISFSCQIRLELNTVIQVEVTRAIERRNRELCAVGVVFVAIDNCPNCGFVARPSTGENAKLDSGIKRLPLRAREKGRDSSFDCRHAPRGFAIARRDPIPDSPDILPAFPSHSIKEGELQIIGLIPIPAVGDIHHVPRLQPFETVHGGHKLKLVLSPGHDVPGKTLVMGRNLWLECQWMPRFFCRLKKCQRNSVLGISINSVPIDFRHQMRNSVGPRLFLIARPLVPHHHRKEHPHAAPMKVRYHLLDPGQPARHRGNHVLLVPVVDAHIGVGRPN